MPVLDRPPGTRPTRREPLGLVGTSGLALALPGCATSPPLKSGWTAAVMDTEAWGGLAPSLIEEKSYAPRVEGALPKGLRGTLCRNGPGLFDRNGKRRRALLDGDGLVQAFRFGEEGAFYRARFVRTEKFVAEEKAGAFVFGTFRTHAPGGLFANVLPERSIRSPAGITAVPRWGKVFAFDGTAPRGSSTPRHSRRPARRASARRAASRSTRPTTRSTSRRASGSTPASSSGGS